MTRPEEQNKSCAKRFHGRCGSGKAIENPIGPRAPPTEMVVVVLVVVMGNSLAANWAEYRPK
jgi:hypothetical protein